jgi:hypothetical protein
MVKPFPDSTLDDQEEAKIDSFWVRAQPTEPWPTTHSSLKRDIAVYCLSSIRSMLISLVAVLVMVVKQYMGRG